MGCYNNTKQITEETHGDDEKAILDDIGLNWLKLQKQTLIMMNDTQTHGHRC